MGVQEFNTNVLVNRGRKSEYPKCGSNFGFRDDYEGATKKIKSAMVLAYDTMRSGQSKLEMSLSAVKTIKVTIIGSKQPGNYSVSSLATVYNALFLGGGPAKNGSYRDIELIRNNKVFKNIDIYRFLVNEDQLDNIVLKDNDVIRIPAYTHRVTLEGQVKRLGIFEMKKEEAFTDLVAFTADFNEFAYTVSVRVLQKTDIEFKVKDLKSSYF